MSKPATDTSKQVYRADKNVNSVIMPYIPTLTLDGEGITPEPSFLTDKYDVPGYKLTEIQGCRLVFVDGEWADHGWNAVWTQVTEKDS